MGKIGNTYKSFFVGKLEGRYHSKDPGIVKEIILEWILGKYGGKAWTGCIWIRIGTSGRLLETR
jgi:hypothetical protein